MLRKSNHRHNQQEKQNATEVPTSIKRHSFDPTASNQILTVLNDDQVVKRTDRVHTQQPTTATCLWSRELHKPEHFVCRGIRRSGSFTESSAEKERPRKSLPQRGRRGRRGRGGPVRLTGMYGGGATNHLTGSQEAAAEWEGVGLSEEAEVVEGLGLEEEGVG